MCRALPPCERVARVELARHEAKQEERAARERYALRGKAATASDLATDERVLAARRKHSRYSRRMVALLRMRKYGTVITCGAVSEYSAADGGDGLLNAHAISDRSLSLRGFLIPDFVADFAAARQWLAKPRGLGWSALRCKGEIVVHRFVAPEALQIERVLLARRHALLM